MKKQKILLSICIPTFNRTGLLEQSLRSITSQFQNKKVDSSSEIIISNNNSKDETEQMVRKFQKHCKHIRYFKNSKNI